MIKFILFSLLIIFSASSIADTNTEIKHLLNFVEKTDCSYQRNGTSHNGAEAREHIQKKYDYYKDDIVTAEDFIAYSATKSMISGKKYTIICQNQPEQYSADWLNKELLKLRTQLVEK